MGNKLYLIVSDDTTKLTRDFEVEPERFIRELTKKWPNSSVTISKHAEQSLVYWDIIDDGDWFITDGTLFPQFVAFRYGKTVKATIDFVLWFRNLIPATEPLLFTFDAYGTYFPIASSVSRDDIRKIMATWS